MRNTNCYAASYGDCSEKISTEHFISRAILEALSENKRTLFLGGASFSPDEVRRLSVSSLGSNILCSRHNSALSPLDTEAARFFSDLLSITQKSQIVNATYCGEDLERWMLKALIGLLASGIIGNVTGQTAKIPPALWMLDILYGRREFNLGAGLGVFPSPVAPDAPIEITINSEKEGAHIYGIRVCMFGINLHLMTAKALVDETGQYFHRPSSLEMPNGSILTLAWLSGKAGPALKLAPV